MSYKFEDVAPKLQKYGASKEIMEKAAVIASFLDIELRLMRSRRAELSSLIEFQNSTQLSKYQSDVVVHQVSDGDVKHWIVANRSDDVLWFLASETGYAGVGDMLKDYDQPVCFVMPPEESLSVMMDDGKADRAVVQTAATWAAQAETIPYFLCSTEW